MKIPDRIDRSVTLQKEPITLLLDNRSIRVPSRAILELSPKPRVIIDLEFASDDYSASNDVRSRNAIDIRIASGSRITASVSDYWRLGGGTFSGTLIPVTQPVTALAKRSVMTRCRFTLLNFPSLWGKQDIHRPKDPNGKSRVFYVVQRIHLDVDAWSITISGVDKMMSLDHRMRRDGGSAISHAGYIVRSDGSDFHLHELEEVLRALHLFLSFVRGSYCGVSFLLGQDSSGKRVWQQWGTYEVQPWSRDISSWLCVSQSEVLSVIFRDFWNRFTDRKWHVAVSRAIHWYLRSNESDDPRIGIILSQAALECLAYAVVGAKARRKEGEWIADTLIAQGIQVQVPSDCQELARFANQFKWAHGPHALVTMRNELVHAIPRHGGQTHDARLEAWELGQYYIELILLRLFGYNGHFVNRLKQRQQYASRIEQVPWGV